MDNFSFWTQLAYQDNSYHRNLVHNTKWIKCDEFQSDFNNPNGYRAKYQCWDYRFLILHSLYLPNNAFAPMKHSFHLSSFKLLNDIRNIYSPQVSDIPSLEAFLIQSMSNLGIRYPGAIELTKFDFDINVKFKDSIELELVKEALLNIPCGRSRKRWVKDTNEGFTFEFRSKSKKIGLSIYDKEMQMKSKYNYVNPEIENCLRFSYRINGRSAIKSLFNLNALLFDALLSPAFNESIKRGFKKRLNEIGIFGGAKITNRKKLRIYVNNVSKRYNKKMSSSKILSKIFKCRTSVTPKEKYNIKSKCKKAGVCFTWVGNRYDIEIFLYDLIMDELNAVLNGTSEFSYKEEYATQLRHEKKLFVSVNESTNNSHLNMLKTDNQTNIPIKDNNA